MVDRTKEYKAGLLALSQTQVLVGYPSADATRLGTNGVVSKDARDPEPSEEKASPLNNATIGYLMNTGMPERNVPAREHMATGILAAQDDISNYARQAMKKALEFDTAGMERGYMAMGLTAVNSIKNTITKGIPPPLADSTLRARIAKRKGGRRGEQKELASRAAGNAPSMDVKPLVFSGQLRNAVSFVLRKPGGK